MPGGSETSDDFGEPRLCGISPAEPEIDAIPRLRFPVLYPESHLDLTDTEPSSLAVSAAAFRSPDRPGMFLPPGELVPSHAIPGEHERSRDSRIKVAAGTSSTLLRANSCSRRHGELGVPSIPSPSSQPWNPSAGGSETRSPARSPRQSFRAIKPTQSSTVVCRATRRKKRCHGSARGIENKRRRGADKAGVVGQALPRRKHLEPDPLNLSRASP